MSLNLTLQGFDLKRYIPPLFVFNVIFKIKKLLLYKKHIKKTPETHSLQSKQCFCSISQKKKNEQVFYLKNNLLHRCFLIIFHRYFGNVNL